MSLDHARAVVASSLFTLACLAAFVVIASAWRGYQVARARYAHKIVVTTRAGRRHVYWRWTNKGGRRLVQRLLAPGAATMTVIYCPVCATETPHDWYLPGIWVCEHGPHNPDTIDPNDEPAVA